MPLISLERPEAALFTRNVRLTAVLHLTGLSHTVNDAGEALGRRKESLKPPRGSGTAGPRGKSLETPESREVAGLSRFHFYLHITNAQASFQEAEDCETPPPNLAESCTILGALLT